MIMHRPSTVHTNLDNTLVTSVAYLTLEPDNNLDSNAPMNDESAQSSLTSIVAVGLDGAIGIENRLPWSLRSDLRFFKETTKNNIIIMGRKTYDSIGGCLPLRENVVLSHSPSLFERHEGCSHAHSISETLFLREKWPAKQAFIIGGAQTYKQFSPFVDRYLLTIVNANFQEADAHFDQSVIGSLDDWNVNEINVERVQTEGADEFDFRVFELKHPDPEAVAGKRSELLREFRKKNHLVRRKPHRRTSNRSIAVDEPLLIA